MARTESIQSLPLSVARFGIEPELAARLAEIRGRTYELPRRYHGQSYAGVKQSYAEIKKIGWKDGVAALWSILEYEVWSSESGADPSQPVFNPGEDG